MDVQQSPHFYFAVDRWKDVYSARIIPTGLTPRERERVLGGELCLWSENMNGNNLPVRLWQIGAAGAEVCMVILS